MRLGGYPPRTMSIPMSQFPAIDSIGTGPAALLLPALSSISTRAEMYPLAHALGTRFRCVIPDWPGFGARPRERVKLTPQVLHRFLAALIERELGPQALGIAAGHAAPYLVAAARTQPGRFSHLVLVAPTWRGPFPSMFGDERRRLCRRIRAAIELPVFGEALYRLNVSRPIVARMLRAHVYAAPAHVTPQTLAEKMAVTRQPRARFGTAAFISGGLDPVASRAEFLALFDATLPPVLLLRPAAAPPRSGAEMDALAATGRVATAKIPGALAAHEEYPVAVAEAISDFLAGRIAALPSRPA